MRRHANTCQHRYPIENGNVFFFFAIENKEYFFHFKSYASIGEKGLHKIATAKPIQNTSKKEGKLRFLEIQTIENNERRQQTMLERREKKKCRTTCIHDYYLLFGFHLV